MVEALSVLLTFPTVLYTMPLAVLGAYWTMVLVGALDLGGHGGDLDVDVGHGHLDVGGHDVGGDAHVDGGHELDVDGHLLTDLAAFFGFGRAPVIVVLSLFTFAGWTTSLLGLTVLEQALGGPPGLVPRLALFAASFVAGTASSRLGTRTLAPVFRHERPIGRQGVVGQECVVATGRVDAGFGQADLYSQGSALRVEVRCDGPVRLHQGDRALVAYFDDARDAYVVEPLPGAASVSSQE